MAEAADELSAPLGREITRGKRRFRLPFTKMQVLATALGLFDAIRPLHPRAPHPAVALVE